MDEHRLLDLIDRIYHSLLDPDCWQPALEATANELGAEAGDFVVEDYALGESQDFAWVGYDNDLRMRWDRHFLGNDPSVQSLIEKSPERAWANLIDPDNPDHSRYIRFWLEPQGLRHELGAVLEKNEDRLINIGFARAFDREPFGKNEEELLTRLLPHLSNALKLKERLTGDSRVEKETSVEAVLEAINFPALVVNGSAAVIYANSAAENFCRLQADMSIWRGQLSFNHHQTDQSFRHKLTVTNSIELLATERDRSRLIVKTDNALAENLVIEVIPLRSFNAFGAPLHRNLVIVYDPRKSVSVQPELFEELWDLTPTEARLAKSLIDGNDVTTFARETQISLGTARWHLKNIRSKTSTNSKSDLIRLLRSSLPPL